MPPELFPTRGSDNNTYNFATDFVDGATWAYSKLAWGPTGSAYLTSADNPLPVLDSTSGNLLTSLLASSGAIQTSASDIVTGFVATNDAAGAYQKGVPFMGIRDDELSAVSVTEGNWLPIRLNGRGAAWVAVDTVFDATNDSVAVGVRSGIDGCDTNVNLDVDESEDAIKATPGTLYGFYFTNLHASAKRYLKLYNATVANVSVGTTVPKLTIPLPPDSSGVVMMPWPVDFDTAITVAATTGFADNDTGGPGLNEVIVNTFYK